MVKTAIVIWQKVEKIDTLKHLKTYATLETGNRWPFTVNMFLRNAPTTPPLLVIKVN